MRSGIGRRGWLGEEGLLGSQGGATTSDASGFMEPGWVGSSGLHRDKELICGRVRGRFDPTCSCGMLS